MNREERETILRMLRGPAFIALKWSRDLIRLIDSHDACEEALRRAELIADTEADRAKAIGGRLEEVAGIRKTLEARVTVLEEALRIEKARLDWVIRNEVVIINNEPGFFIQNHDDCSKLEWPTPPHDEKGKFFDPILDPREVIDDAMQALSQRTAPSGS